MGKTVRRNAHKKIAAIFDNTHTVLAFCLRNHFRAEECDFEFVRDEFMAHKDDYYGPKMVDNGDGTFKIRYHSNLWFELDTRPKENAK